MISLQQIWPFLSSLLVTLLLMPLVIRYFRKKQLGQITREIGPSWHQAKSGTPTMGGVAFILATIIVTSLAFLLNLGTKQMALLLMVFVVYGLIGFFDDYIKLIMKRNLGLTSLQKLIGQIIAAIIFYFVADISTVLVLPFGWSMNLGILYPFFVIFWLVGFSNATNLTDGIDGLLASTSLIALTAYGYIAIKQNQFDILMFILILTGGILGFLAFNKKPAKIFMGDVGSLAIGGVFATLSIMLDLEWTLLFIGIIFVIETASVMLQVTSFKTTGKRIFKMTPIHHHFEMSGFSEWKIVILFSIITLIFSLVTIMIVL
ncbi:MAG TPA: phospho-N-acetylmuramoyl-pentapeptide-transferase [Alloiococcus sp.]|nr:phospho-N-acetylmuramoyl-pentapeptide-transferase [Alloiococcus sp.]